MLRDLMNKVYHMQEQMGNISIDKNPREKNEMLQINTVNAMI